VQVSPHTARALRKAVTPGEPPLQWPRPAHHCTPATSHLRDMHLQPVDCLGGLFPCSSQPKAHQQVALPSFAFLPRTGSSSSLAMKHQMDVSAVSGQAISPIRSITERHSLLPSSRPRTPTAPLTGCLPLAGRGYAGYRVPRKYLRSLGLTRTPVARHLRWRTLDPPSLATYRLVQA